MPSPALTRLKAKLYRRSHGFRHALVLGAILLFSSLAGSGSQEPVAFVPSAALILIPSSSPEQEQEADPTLSPSATALATETLVLPSPTLTPTWTPTPSLTYTHTPRPTAWITPVPYDHNPQAILIEADVSGGLISVPRDAHVPSFRLYGDGFVLFAGERAPLSTGLDATIYTGRLSEDQVTSLLSGLRQLGFFSLGSNYAPRPTPPDQATAHISVFLDKVKTVQVYSPESASTPRVFQDAFRLILESVPAIRERIVVSDGMLYSTAAGTVSDFVSHETIAQWSVGNGARLSSASEGIAITASLYSDVAFSIASQFPNFLFREGERVYRVRFAPNLPRSVHLSEWIGTILQAPREFDGRVFDITGYFRGSNLLGEARGTPPVPKSDWVIVDHTGAIYVTGILPQGLSLLSRGDAWTVVRLRAAVVYNRFGTTYLQARRVDTLLPGVTATPSVIPSPLPGLTSTPVLTK